MKYPLILLAAISCSCVPSNTMPLPIDPTECRVSTPDKTLTYQIDPRFTEDEEILIVDAMRIWRHGSGNRIAFSRVMTGSSTADLRFIRIESREETGDHNPKVDADHPANWVGLYWDGNIWLLNNEIETNSLFVAVVVHEIGHALVMHDHMPQDKQEESCMTGGVDPKCLQNYELQPMDRKLYCRYNVCTCD